MPITVKLDLFGTTQTTGIRGSRYDRATRLCLVEGLTIDTEVNHDNINTAINAVRDVVGLYHHKIGISGGITQAPRPSRRLSLQTATGRKFGLTSVWVTLRYYRGRYGNISSQGNILLQTRQDWESIPIWKRTVDALGEEAFDAQGMPSGSFINNPPVDKLADFDFKPKHIMWKRPVEKIYVRTLLTHHPSQQVAGLIGRINSDSVSMGAVDFAPGTLRYEGANVDVDVNTTGGNPFYEVVYNFTAIDTGHYRQTLIWVQAPPPIVVGVWDTVNDLMYPSKPFAHAFPYAT